MIPAELEKLILNGQAEFNTMQIGYTNLNVLPVPNDSFIVITGIDILPPRFTRYEEETAQTTLCRIEVKSADKYNHFVIKSNNGFKMESIGGLYLTHKSDIGISLTAPQNDALLWGAFNDLISLTYSQSLRQIVNLNTNPIDVTPQYALKGTRGSTAGTKNFPADARLGNDLKYTNGFFSGPEETETNQFNFTSEANNYAFSAVSGYASMSPGELNNGFYVLIKYVKVNKNAVNRLL
jgi:hypothetical protein